MTKVWEPCTSPKGVELLLASELRDVKTSQLPKFLKAKVAKYCGRSIFGSFGIPSNHYIEPSGGVVLSTLMKSHSERCEMAMN
jgi:hypothetical protein